MSVNSSSNDSLPHPHLPIHPNLPPSIHCLFIRPSIFIFTSFNIIYILLLLPLCSFILYHGLQQWRQSRSTSSAVTMSHSDSFTYHMATIELINVFGCILCFSVHVGQTKILLVAFYLFTFIWFGQSFFHVLTCVERYLAVVHPVTYLGLRRERGTRIRNISIGCVWLLCFAGTSVITINTLIFIIMEFSVLILSLTVVSFCSISVLRVLTRPGPGEQGGGRERVDQSKQRAFYTIVAILGALLLKFASSMVWAVLYMKGGRTDCVLMTVLTWLNLPSSLVLPLLFLHRKGKSVCCRNNQTG